MKALRALRRAFSERLYRSHVEFNYECLAPSVPHGARLLDVGAWTCQLGALFAARKQCDVTNVDVVDANVTDLPLVRYDGVTLPFADASFDVVTLAYVLHHSRDAGRVLAEARRVLRPGGVLLVAEDRVDGRLRRAITTGFHVWLRVFTGMRWNEFRTPPAWQRLFAAQGLVVEAVRELGHHLGRAHWPENILFVLRPRATSP